MVNGSLAYLEAPGTAAFATRVDQGGAWPLALHPQVCGDLEELSLPADAWRTLKGRDGSGSSPRAWLPHPSKDFWKPSPDVPGCCHHPFLPTSHLASRQHLLEISGWHLFQSALLRLFIY